MTLTVPGTKVVLRDFLDGDVDEVLAVIGDDRVTRWLPMGSGDRAAAEELVAVGIATAAAVPRTRYHLAMTGPDDPDRVVGFARLELGGTRAAELDLAVQVEWQGYGYAVDAARTLLDLGFGDLDLHRITAAPRRDNVVALKLLKGLGFSPEGLLRQVMWSQGSWHDCILCSLLAHERSLTARS